MPRSRASASSAEPGRTKCETSAMWTPRTRRPFSSVESERASSKSLAVAGSIVTIVSPRRSSRGPRSARSAETRCASASTSGGKGPGRPNSRSTATVSSEGLSAGPTTATISASGSKRGLSQDEKRTTTRSPSRAAAGSSTWNVRPPKGTSGTAVQWRPARRSVQTTSRAPRSTTRTTRPVGREAPRSGGSSASSTRSPGRAGPTEPSGTRTSAPPPSGETKPVPPRERARTPRTRRGAASRKSAKVRRFVRGPRGAAGTGGGRCGGFLLTCGGYPLRPRMRPCLRKPS